MVPVPTELGCTRKANCLFNVTYQPRFKRCYNNSARKDKTLKKRMLVLALCFAVASPLFAQKKEEERISNSATVFRALLAGPLPIKYPGPGRLRCCVP